MISAKIIWYKYVKSLYNHSRHSIIDSFLCSLCSATYYKLEKFSIAYEVTLDLICGVNTDYILDK